jgi:hypothetical protein
VSLQAATAEPALPGRQWRPLSAEAPPGASGVGFLYAAFCHIAVSKTLHIMGMFMPKFGLMPAFALTFAAGFSLGAVSTARSHDPFSWERATEKNKNT